MSVKCKGFPGIWRGEFKGLEKQEHWGAMCDLHTGSQVMYSQSPPLAQNPALERKPEHPRGTPWLLSPVSQI